jgi:hypothetical protein
MQGMRFGPDCVRPIPGRDRPPVVIRYNAIMPTDARAETLNRIGRCIDCNYPLQGLAEPRCPECGRGFDPANPKTMNLGRPIGPRARLLSRPTGRPTVVVALLALVAMLAVTRPPLGAPSLAAARYWLQPRLLKSGESLITWRDWTYSIGLVLGIAGTMTFGVRKILRSFISFRYRQFPLTKERRLAQSVMIYIALACALMAVLLGWPLQVGQHWVARQMAVKPDQSGNIAQVACPIMLSSEQEDAALHAALVALRSPQQRNWALAMLAQKNRDSYGTGAIERELIDVLKAKDNASVCVAELRLLALTRNPTSAEVFVRYMKDPDAGVRAAAADGLGILYGPAYLFPEDESRNWMSNSRPARIRLSDQPPILADLQGWAKPQDNNSRGWTPDSAPPAEVQEALRDMVRTGATSPEREAAARAMLPFPQTGYSLRMAEWGVWISDGSDLKLVRSVLDEIPAFVHRTANPLSELDERVNPILFVTKPIIHLTASQLMTLDLTCRIRAGRPWFAYPRPDDFSVNVTSFQYFHGPATAPGEVLAPLDNPALGSLSDIGEGYPWIEPRHRQFGSMYGTGTPFNDIDSVGLRWQSLVVSPERLAWMTPPAIPSDPKYAWWDRLRQVPTSWVSSRGESERFLYYDGPTLAKSPLDVTLAGNALHLDPRLLPDKGWLPSVQVRPEPSVPTSRRRGLFIRVAAGHVSGQAVDAPYTKINVALSGPAPLDGSEVKARFGQMLQDAGLTGPEAAGLIACWAPQFFEKEGTRFLLLLSQADYDALCPMTVRPVPTERARVGIVLTEF